jgi:hypothetical protein
LFATARATSCKFQAPKTKFQKNTNELNSKFETAELVAGQTNDPSAFVPKGLISGPVNLANSYGTTAVNVLVIEY